MVGLWNRTKEWGRGKEGEYIKDIFEFFLREGKGEGSQRGGDKHIPSYRRRGVPGYNIFFVRKFWKFHWQPRELQLKL